MVPFKHILFQEEACNLAKQFFEGRHFLLIVDNVWSLSEIPQYLPGGARGHVSHPNGCVLEFRLRS